MKRPRLTIAEIDALLAAAGNADPAMFEDYPTEKEGDRAYRAWETGMEKLREMLELRRNRAPREITGRNRENNR